MVDERWKSEDANLQTGGEKRKSEDADMQVGQVEGGKKNYQDVGYGGFSKDYKPIPPENVRPELNFESPRFREKRYPLDWTEKEWSKVENHYVGQIEQIMESWHDDTYTGWAVWMELTKLMILLLDELGLARLCAYFYTTLFEPGYPRIESFRFNLFMPKSEQEEYEAHQDRKGESYDRTVEFWSPEEEEGGEEQGEGSPEEGRHFWSPRPEAVEEAG